MGRKWPKVIQCCFSGSNTALHCRHDAGHSAVRSLIKASKESLSCTTAPGGMLCQKTTTNPSAPGLLYKL